MRNKINISVVGLGYVGLPLILELGKFYRVVGYDVDKLRVDSLKKNYDFNNEFKKKNFLKKNIVFTNKINDIQKSNFYIIAVPTPVNEKKLPDIKLINLASQSVGKLLKKGDIVVYESTVYPGFTENISVKILEKYSGLKYNVDFFCGYSPERINPGDKKHTITNTVKLISGSNKRSLRIIKKIYSKIIKAGIEITKDIKHAEAAKVIENIQRDINIAFINELKLLFTKMKISTPAVLKAARTKWNFLNFTPGLVGGHCIGVDPYYLLYRARQFNFKTNILRIGRKINDQMVYFYCREILKLIKKFFHKKKIKILILGATFKENVADCRNSKVFDMYNYFTSKNFFVQIYDPLVSNQNLVRKKFNFIKIPKKNFYHVVVLTVSHNFFKKLGLKKIMKFCNKKFIIYDIKNFILKNKDYITNV